MEIHGFESEFEMRLLVELHPGLAAFAQQRGFQVLEERRSDAFDNALVVLDCGGLRLRVVRDRGTILIDFGQNGQQEWHSADHVLEFLGGSSSDHWASALEDDFEKVTDLMNSDLLQRGYIAFVKRKSDEDVKGLFPKPTH